MASVHGRQVQRPLFRRDHIATSLAIEPDDFGYSPFARAAASA